MDISEVAKNTGIPASTLRYYEDKGLIKSVGRNGLKRVFMANVIDQLALISLGQTAGFTLEEIAEMLGADGKPNIDRDKLNAKADELDESIRQLTAMRNGLRHAAVCSAPSHMECPKFRKLLGLAASGAITSNNTVGPTPNRHSKAAVKKTKKHKKS